MNAAVELFESPQIAEAAIVAALAESVRAGRAALEVLAESVGLEGEALVAALANTFGYELLTSAELQHRQPDFSVVSATEAGTRRCIVLEGCDGPTAAFCDPFDADLRPWLEARIEVPLRWALVAQDDLVALVARHERETRAMDAALRGAQGDGDRALEVENLSLASISQDSSPVVKLVHSTVFDALRAGASDIHLETGAAALTIRYRLDGVLVHVATVQGAETSEQVISRIKVMSELDIAERRVPQDGRFKIAVDGRPTDFRVSVIPSVFGEDAVLRILDKQAVTDRLQGLRLDVLGFDSDTVLSLRRLSAQPYGMLLVTGPTGSGKTTTLYAAISETNTGHDKIVTIEDPVEYQLPGVLQIPVNEKKGLTFARGLRSILRHDPDKIMVGEIRDPETAQIAIQSALTGHLVFTTVHANNVFDVLSRFVHMGVDAYSCVSALNGILAQRLVRLVCGQCSEPVTLSAQVIEAAGISPGSCDSAGFRAGRGCGHCRGTGYRGRKAIGELLVLNDELREAIIGKAPARQLKQLARDAGVRFIRAAAVELVRDGQTTIEEINRVTSLA